MAKIESATMYAKVQLNGSCVEKASLTGTTILTMSRMINTNMSQANLNLLLRIIMHFRLFPTCVGAA